MNVVEFDIHHMLYLAGRRIQLACGMSGGGREAQGQRSRQQRRP
jgi:hypothetical protein